MIKKLLVTGSFFVNQQHIKTLESAGYNVVHLDVPAASEQQLVKAIAGISVYIMGGTEQVTSAVIEAADSLESIIFSGVDYDKFIPATSDARQKGIEIYNAPGANAIAVAEFAIGLTLLMQRRLLGVSRSGGERFLTTSSIQGSIVGIIGGGNIGSKIIDAVSTFEPKEILYYNRSPKDLPGHQVELTELIESSDITFLSLPMKAGQLINAELVNKLKPGSLLISLSPMNLIDFDALFTRLKAGDIRAAIDWPSPTPAFDNLALESWYSTGSHSAYNTGPAVQSVGDSVTAKAIELLN